ncbi:hypothetical protein [Natrinema salinisoli]|uniref:hypothetical protein n=1 Tax=Natrinema salinisoli TaxID=2878535 RepID=UPI001CF052EA|nr:hypothetical protein [Natrinema salinisoli]
MTRNTSTVDDEEQANTGPPVEGDVYEHGSGVGPNGPRMSMSRRRVLQGLAAGGAATALGTGTVAADHGANDPIDVTGDGDSTNGDHADVDPARIAAGAAVGGALVAGPAGAVAGAGLGYAAGTVENEYEVVGDWMYGSYEDRIDTQLQADLYSHAETVQNELIWNAKQFDNRMELAQNNWIAQAQFDAIQKLNELGVEDSTDTTAEEEQQVIDAAVNGVIEASMPALKSALAIESSVNLRLASFNAREEVANIDLANRATKRGHVDSGENVKGVKPLHLDLLNGDTVEAWGLYQGSPDDSYDNELVHEHFTYPAQAPDTGFAGYAVQELAPLPDDTSRAGEYTGETDENGNTILASALSTQTGVHYDGNVIRPSNIGDAGIEYDLGDGTADSFSGLYWNLYGLIDTLIGEMETYAAEVYNAVSAGQISVDELITPAIFAEELARDWATTGDTGYSRALLANLGVDTDLETSMTVTVSPTDNPATTLDYGSIGATADFTTTLSNASADVTVTLDPGGATDTDGTMHVPAAGGTLNLRVSPFTDDPSAPAYAVSDVELTTAAGDTVTVAVSEMSDVDGTVAGGQAWYDDLDAGGDGSVTIDAIDVTYSTTDSETGETSTTTDSVVTAAGVGIELDSPDVGWTYADAALATNWRPHGGVPENWSEAAMQGFVFEGVTLSNTSGPDTLTAEIGFAHDGSPTVNDSAPDTYTVPSDRSIQAQVTGTITNVDAVTITTVGGDSVTSTVDGEGFATVPHTDFAAAGETFTIDTVEVEYTDPSDSTAYTATAGTVDAELSVENVEIPEYDFMVEKWYDTSNKGEDDEIVIATTTGDWVDVDAGDVFNIESATDVDGNELDGVVLGDTNRHTLDVTRVEEETRRSIELQKKTEEVTDDPTGGGGSGDGSAGSLAAVGAIVGGGAVAYAISRLRGGD